VIIGTKWGAKGEKSRAKNIKRKDILDIKRRKVLCKHKGQVTVRFKYEKCKAMGPNPSLQEMDGEPKRNSS